MNKYRSHNCSELSESDVGKVVSLSGWLHRKRDHGNLLFIDLRDHFGLTQCVIENDNNFFSILEKTKQESVLTITGKTHHGRVSTSVLKVLKMESYIAVDENDFVRKGSQAIQNTDELIYLRKNLRDNIKKSYLCNGRLFAKNIEKEYFKMFDKIK